MVVKVLKSSRKSSTSGCEKPASRRARRSRWNSARRLSLWTLRRTMPVMPMMSCADRWPSVVLLSVGRPRGEPGRNSLPRPWRMLRVASAISLCCSGCSTLMLAKPNSRMTSKSWQEATQPVSAFAWRRTANSICSRSSRLQRSCSCSRSRRARVPRARSRSSARQRKRSCRPSGPSPLAARQASSSCSTAAGSRPRLPARAAARSAGSRAR
mmetsp:Transcript_48767/g.150972  ORF Transcript_48767/g.150972 Transcript_48767/m.150972 type:complete len:212 (-) Transcript_48767:1363-1998(-)